MAAHRYWRATAFEAYGGADLELSEFHLLSGGVRVDATATITASVAPDVSGVLANLQDDALDTAARWSAQAVKELALTWDFGGAPVSIDGIALAGASEWRFPLIVNMQWSDNNLSWTQLAESVTSGIHWSGSLAMTEVLNLASSDVFYAAATSVLNFNGADASTTIIDNKGKAWTVEGGAALSTAQSKYGGASLRIGAVADGVVESATTDLSTGSYTVEAWVRLSALVVADGNCVLTSGSNVFPNRWLLDVYVPSSGTIAARCITNNNNINFTKTGSYTLSEFVHIAWVNDEPGDVFTIFVAGASIGSRAKVALANHGPLRVGKNSSGWVESPYFIDDLVITPAAKYSGTFTPPPQAGSLATTGLNRVKGRSSVGDALSLGAGPIITYGTPKIALPPYLSVESGSVKDQITGVLGDGVGRVKGTVATKGSPNQFVHRKVRLIRERDGMVIREMWSDAITGEYDFQWVDEAQTFTVVSYDHLRNYRAVIADNLTPELMP